MGQHGHLSIEEREGIMQMRRGRSECEGEMPANISVNAPSTSPSVNWRRNMPSSTGGPSV